MTSKRSTLLSCGSRGARGDPHAAVSIPASCQVGERPAEDTWITALGRERCTVRLASVGMTRAEPLVLRFADEAPIAGRLDWIGQGELGFAFDTPLAEDLLERLLALDPSGNVVLLHRGPAR
jgi:hypothetical protein